MIQVYTGNGKGKTTAALGLALRAAGAGLKVYIGQFAKGRACSEHKALRGIKNIKLERFGSGCFLRTKPREIDRKLAGRGMQRVKQIIGCGDYQVIILDEINIVLRLKLVDLKEFLDLVRQLSKKTELVLTGRYAPASLIKEADLVSHIREVKHYYRRGIKARKGIEL
jgi:cob(I)alamin adenosyltransferase